jgi:hypothetical protein
MSLQNPTRPFFAGVATDIDIQRLKDLARETSPYGMGPDLLVRYREMIRCARKGERFQR